MLIINSGHDLERALAYPLDLGLTRLLLLRRDQLGEIEGSARFVVVQAGDRPSAVEEELGWSIFRNPADGTRWGDPEYSPGHDTLQAHPCAYELTYDLTDDFTQVVLIQRAAGVHPDFLDFCAEYSSQDA